MTKFLPISFLILLLAAAAPAQEPCRKTLTESPKLFGLQVGMSFEQMQAVLAPGIKLKRKKTGEGSYFENFIDQKPPPNLHGVRAIFLRIFDNKLYQVEIFYEDSGTPVMLESFLERISNEHGIARATWTIVNKTASIDCGLFQIEIDTILNPRIQVTDTAAIEAFNRKALEQKRRKNE